MGRNLVEDIVNLNDADIVKLETYLKDVSYHDLKRYYYFKFSQDRSTVERCDKTNKKLTISLATLVDNTWDKLNMFFKFKDVTKEDFNKPDIENPNPFKIK